LSAFAAALVVCVLAADPSAYFAANAGAVARLSRRSVAQVPARLAAARRALDQHDFERARQQAVLAVELAPDKGEPWLVLGLALFRAERPADARPAFERAAHLMPRSAMAHFNLGSTLYQLGRYGDAEQAYVQAASLDGKLRPLALLRAGLAALDGEHFDAAERRLQAAAAAAGPGPLAAEADKLLRELDQRRAERISAVLREAHEGKRALAADRVAEAVGHYRAALLQAVVAGVTPEDHAELEYGLGHALLRHRDDEAAQRAFAAAVELMPKDPDFRFMLAVARFRNGDDDAAKADFEATLRLKPSTEDVAQAHEYLVRIAKRAQPVGPRYLIDLRVGVGYDSNVTQSGVIVRAFHGADQGAKTLVADLDALVRLGGSSQGALYADYRFSQLAYLAKAVDMYSLQEHDLQLVLKWLPSSWLSTDALIDGWLLAEGIEGYRGFQDGLSLGPRLVFAEAGGLETRLRYQHSWKAALDPTYRYLEGERDEASAIEEWHGGRVRLSLGYRFAREAVGVETFKLSSTESYHIPFSYMTHEVAANAAFDLPWGLRASIGQRYEHRPYLQPSYITDKTVQSYFRDRVDDRYTLDLSLRRLVLGPFSLEAEYELIVNASTIDNSRKATRDDYDNANYIKHVFELQLAFLF
jgi:Flp pilus assembly protein TadD